MISFEVVFPIFLLMALGFSIKRIGLISEGTVKQMNTVVFRVFLPTMLFKNAYESAVSEVFNGKLMLFALGCVSSAILLLYLLVPLLVKDNKKRGVLIQGVFRSNFVIFGLPIAETLCGTSATGTAAVLIAFVIPVFNVATVITLEVFGGKRVGAGRSVAGILKNPLIIASLLGLLVNASGLRFPHVLETAMGNVAGITTPLALFLLGASIRFSTVKGNAWHLIAGILAKLVLLPAVFLSLPPLLSVFAVRSLPFSSPSLLPPLRSRPIRWRPKWAVTRTWRDSS